MSNEREEKCENRIDEELRGRIEDFRKVMAYANQNDGRVVTKDWDEYEDLMGWINEYALAFGDDLHARAKKLELSWGGPQDYFLFYDDGDIEYHFLDWFDGAKRRLEGADYEMMREFYDTTLYFEE